jgi:predicted nucleic acid-binding protein
MGNMLKVNNHFAGLTGRLREEVIEYALSKGIWQDTAEVRKQLTLSDRIPFGRLSFLSIEEFNDLAEFVNAKYSRVLLDKEDAHQSAVAAANAAGLPRASIPAW